MDRNVISFHERERDGKLIIMFETVDKWGEYHPRCLKNKFNQISDLLLIKVSLSFYDLL